MRRRSAHYAWNVTDPMDNPNPGGPDNVWAPWRLQYLESFADDEHNR